MLLHVNSYNSIIHALIKMISRNLFLLLGKQELQTILHFNLSTKQQNISEKSAYYTVSLSTIMYNCSSGTTEKTSQ